MAQPKSYPGIYILHLKHYDQLKPKSVYKIGCSIDVGRRIRDSVYHTPFLSGDEPKYLGSVHPHGYQTIQEILFLEKLVHHHFRDKRIDINREMFYVVTLQDISEYLNSLGIDHDIVLQAPKPIWKYDTLKKKEKIIKSFEDMIKVELKIKESKLVIPHSNTTENIKFNIDLDLLGIPESKFKPLSFQQDIIDKLCHYYINGGEKGTMLVPCGVGKSYISLFMIKKLNLNLAVILVPTIILSEQFEIVAKDVLIEYDIFRFCSEINKFNIYKILNQNLQVKKKTVVICTYDSAINKLDSNGNSSGLYCLFDHIKIYPDMNIYDEAHNTCVISKGVNEKSKHRDIILLKSAKKLFMTATQKIIRSEIKKVKIELDENSDEELDEELTQNNSEKKIIEEDIEEIKQVASMNDEQYYGKVIVNIDFVDTIEKGYISDYRFIVVNSGDPVEVIKKSMSELNIQHMLTYHSRIESAEYLTVRLNNIGIKAFTINGSMTSLQRKQILNNFEKTPNSVLTSCKVLSEGMSLTYVDSVYFVDFKRSQIDIIQSMCRCLRLNSNKILATIIIENDINKYADILKNVVYLDRRLKCGKTRAFMEIGFTQEGIKKVKKELDYIIRGRNEVMWEKMLNLCIQYENENNTIIKNGTIIKNVAEYKDLKIGEWVHTTKKNYKGIGNRLLTPEEKMRLLDSRTFKKWVADGGPTKVKNEWDLKYALCLEYEATGKKILYETKIGEYYIGQWLHNHIRNWKGTARRIMTDDEKELLIKIKTFRDYISKEGNNVRREDKWEYSFQLCLEYERNNSNELIKMYKTNQTKYRDKNIGSWLQNATRCYKESGSRLLTDEEKEKLKLLRSFNNWLINRK